MEKQNKFGKISNKLFPRLSNINSDNERFTIIFSGIPGSGKSSLSKIIESRYNDVRINNDHIRRIIDEGGLTENSEEMEELLQDYMFNLLENYPFKNGLLVLDKSMDRQYERFFALCESKNLDYFIIRMYISKESAIERITRRENVENIGDLKKSMDKWIKDYQNFGRSTKADIVLDSNDINLNELYRLLDKVFKTNKKSQ